MATTYPVIEDAAEEIYGSLADRRIREKIEARQDYERRQRMIESMIADLKEQIADKDAELAEERARTADKDAKLADKDAEIAELKRLLGMA